MITTRNLGLTVWNNGTDPYNHEELAENWAKVDNHDHTEGKGARITSAAIADGAITAPKIAPGAIPAYQIEDGSITNSKLSTDSVSTAKIQNGAITEAKLAGGISFPVGIVLPYGGSAAPAGWFLCDGATYSRTTYSALFAVLGTSYGAGDGSTTFGVPDLRGRVPVGVGTHTDVNARGDSDAVGVASRTPLHAHGATGYTVAAHNHESIYPGINTVNGKLKFYAPDAAFLDAVGSVISESTVTEGSTRTIGIDTEVATGSADRFKTRTSSTSPAVNGTSDNASPPYQALNFIVKHGA